MEPGELLADAVRAASTDPRHAGGSDVIPFGEAVRAWLAISLQTFGGPAGQIAVMQRTLVDEKRWVGQKRFLLRCRTAPGPDFRR